TVGQSYHFEFFKYLFMRYSLDLTYQLQVFFGRQVRVEVRPLNDSAYFFKGIVCRYFSFKPVEISRSFVYHVQDNTQGGRFSAAVRPQYTVNVPLFYGKRQVTHRGEIAEFFGKVMNA